MSHIYAILLIKSQMRITARDDRFEFVAFYASEEVASKQIYLLLWDFIDQLSLTDSSLVLIDSLSRMPSKAMAP